MDTKPFQGQPYILSLPPSQKIGIKSQHNLGLIMEERDQYQFSRFLGTFASL
jgi:hypothetical protein